MAGLARPTPCFPRTHSVLPIRRLLDRAVRSGCRSTAGITYESGEPVRPSRDRGLRQRCVRDDAVEPVIPAGPDVQLGTAARLPDPGRVGDVLVPEGVRRPDVDER